MAWRKGSVSQSVVGSAWEVMRITKPHWSTAISHWAPREVWMILDWIPRNESDLVAMGHEKVLLDIEIGWGNVVAWVIQDGTMWTIRCNWIGTNLLSYWLSKEQAISNMEAVVGRSLQKRIT